MAQHSNPRARREALQRVQVGFIGIAAVLLVVTLANLVIRSVRSDGSVMSGFAASQGTSMASTNNGSSDGTADTEPLADLGVTPKSEQGDSVTPSVPDLEPDPRLSKPMDQDPDKVRSQRR